MKLNISSLFTIFKSFFGVYDKNEKEKFGEIECDNRGLVIVLYTNNRIFPHFCIEGENFKCCIRLDKPKYYKSLFAKDILTKNELYVLNKYLNMRSPNFMFGKYVELSEWERMIMAWNICKPLTYIKSNIMPDYSKLQTKD